MKIKVAIFEDHPDLREGLKQLIQNTPGLKCVGAWDSCDYLVIRLLQNEPHVVLMDIGLPGISGIEGVRQLKAHFPAIDVIMLTVYEDDAKILDSICAGASGYLLKKTPPAQILEAIKEIRNGGAPMTSSIARKVLAHFQHHSPNPTADYQLSEREQQVLADLVKGFSYKMIAESQFISIDTVRSHIKNIYSKLQVHSKTEAVAKALKSKLV
ncbi:MAG: response regulator transcription factor [Ignavibacteriae bacterium]|nr:response regulator transcription factor [Ignavibacteriota bacterium]